LPKAWQSFNIRIALIAIIAFIAMTSLYWIHELYIEFILLVWNIAIVLGIILWEKEKVRKGQFLKDSYTQDEKWARAKKEFDDVSTRIRKSDDTKQKKNLETRRRYLANELRRLEWSIREKEANAVFNAQNGGMKKLGPQDPDNNRNSSRLSLQEAEEKSRAAEGKENEYLEKIIGIIISIVRGEPSTSRSAALQPISNELRAHYFAIKRRDQYAVSLSNCWAVWSIVSSILNSAKPEDTVLKYASKSFKAPVSRLLQETKKLNVTSWGLNSKLEKVPADSPYESKNEDGDR
jgi:hypothetical protein